MTASAMVVLDSLPFVSCYLTECRYFLQRTATEIVKLLVWQRWCSRFHFIGCGQ